MEHTLLNKNVSILVNSCDSYSDLWPAFFTLLKKYWDVAGVRIILNTESKDYQFPGLDIECIHCANEPYGGRMIHALRQVKTKYVINMLDDFFLRKTVDNIKVNQILDWMDADKRIVYFSFDPYSTEYDLDCPYEGFFQICPGSEYTLTLQLAIWRTKKFLSYWSRDITPWEWELYTNIKTCWKKNDLFYRIRQPQIFDYGYNKFGEWMGVQRGKWVMEDVVPLFEKEGIVVDLDTRNNKEEKKNTISSQKNKIFKWLVRIEPYQEVQRLLGVEGIIARFLFGIHSRKMRRKGETIHDDFYSYTRKKARTAFLNHGKKIDKNENG